MTREEAINEIKSWAIPSEKGREVLETLIPELRESKDERIRKAIVGLIEELQRSDKYFAGVELTDMLAYLERQKEPHYTQRNALFDKCVENCDPEVMKKVSDEVDGMLEKEQKPVEKPVNWTELTWKDIVELEGIINNVHYEFSAGIGQKSFGNEVLERFRNQKDDAKVDACE